MKKTALRSVLISVGVVYVLSARSFGLIQPAPAKVVFTDVTGASGITFKHVFSPRVKVTSGGFVQTDERRSGGSYISQNDARLHFGLEKRDRVDAVHVRWPSGATQEFANLPVNAVGLADPDHPAPKTPPKRS